MSRDTAVQAKGQAAAGQGGLSALWQALRAEPTAPKRWEALAQAYAQRQLPWHWAYAQTQAQRCAQALGRSTGAQAAAPSWPEGIARMWGEGGDVQLSLGVPWPGLSQVVERLSACVQADGGDWLSVLYLARALELRDGLRQPGAAPAREEPHPGVRSLVRQALRSEPLAGESGHLLAQWRLRAGQPAAALVAVQAALQQAPQRHGSWLLQAQIQMQLGLESGARHAFEQAGRSRNPELLALLAEKLFQFNFAEQALAVRQAVVQLRPQQVQGWLQLAELQAKLWQLDQAKDSVAKALQLEPGHAQALRWREDLQAAGNSRAQFEQALARFEAHGLQDNAQGAQRLLMQSLYQGHVPAQRVAQLHQRVGQAMQEQALRAFGPELPEPQPLPWSGQQRRLRVGYVSGDLHRQHPVNVFMLPVLQRHDHERLEVFIYQTGTLIDEYTRCARSCADHWREAAHLSDRALRQLIVADRIDVLVDLAGHTATHRLGVFASRAAPLQLSYLGYPHSTGLPCMDLMVVDAVVAPPEHAQLFTERLERVSGSVFCWAPTEEYPLAPEAGARQRTGVVFGSFNNLLKLSDETVAVWARILHACADSRLLLKSAVLADPAVHTQTLQRFAQLGIGAQRLELRGPSELSLMMQEYLDVDVALDPFPYNGGTTSLQALWMGCPLVSLEGANFVSRMGASFLTHLGRTQWLAHSEDRYVRIALALAEEVRARPWSRQQQRERMRASALCQIERHTRELEDIFLRAAAAKASPVAEH